MFYVLIGVYSGNTLKYIKSLDDAISDFPWCAIFCRFLQSTFQLYVPQFKVFCFLYDEDLISFNAFVVYLYSLVDRNHVNKTAEAH